MVALLLPALTPSAYAAGITLVCDINTSLTPRSSDPFPLLSVGNQSFFFATTDAYGRELWRSDGTSAGTVLLQDLAPGLQDANPTELTVSGANLFFAADNGSVGVELWRLALN